MLKVCPCQAGQKRGSFDRPSEKGARTSSLEYLFAEVGFTSAACGTEAVLSCVTRARLVFDSAHRTGCNLMRKKPSTKRFETAQRQAHMSGCLEDGHSFTVEDRDYVTMTPAKKTELAREALAQEIETATWLTNQEIGAMGTVYFTMPSNNMESISALDLGGTHGHGVKRPEWHVAKPSERPAKKKKTNTQEGAGDFVAEHGGAACATDQTTGESGDQVDYPPTGVDPVPEVIAESKQVSVENLPCVTARTFADPAPHVETKMQTQLDVPPRTSCPPSAPGTASISTNCQTRGVGCGCAQEAVECGRSQAEKRSSPVELA